MRPAFDFAEFFYDVIGIAVWTAPVVLFILFLVLFIVNLRKIRKAGARPAKAIVFGSLSGFFLLASIAEVLMMLSLAAAVAHM